MKKIILILLSVLLIAATMLIPVNATTPCGIAAEEAAGAVGETVDIYVSVYGLTEVTSIALEYSIPEGLTYKSAEWVLEGGDIAAVDTAKNAAVWGIDSKKAKNFTESTKVLKISYTVAENAPDVINVEFKATIKIDSLVEKQVYSTTTRVKLLIPATDVKLSENALSLDLSGTAEGNLTAQITPQNTTDKLSWTSSNPNVATVDRNGKVTAVALGTAQITATVGNVSDVCNVTVSCSHTGATEYKASSAACDADGNNLYYKCDTCRQYLKADKATATTPEAEKITKLGHNAVHHPKVAATCSAFGTQEHWSCDRCSKNYGNSECTIVLMNTQLPKDAGNHVGETKVEGAQAATCCESGYSGDTKCLSCGVVTVKGSTVPATGMHTAGSQWFKDGTHHWHKCTTGGCDASVDKAEHSFQWKLDKAATEYETGLKHEECVCGDKRSEGTVIPKLDHVHKGIAHHAAVAATCVKAGTVEYWTCSSDLCSGKYYGDEKCQLKLDTIVEKINPANHTGGTQIKNATEVTCYQNGYTGDTYCKGCGVKIAVGSVINATGKHVSTGAWLTDGTYHYHACATEGCAAELDKASHSFAWITDKAATEQVAGIKHEQCACGYKRNENTSIEKLKHEPALVPGKENTCTQDGIAEHFYCSNCGGYYASQGGKPGAQIKAEEIVLKATGHSYGQEWKSDANGHWHVCQCGEIADKAAHTAKLEGAVDATKDQPGYTGDSICSVCGFEISKGEVIPSKKEEVLEDVQNAQNGSSIQIAVPDDDGTPDAVVPSEILETAKGKDVELVLDMGDYQWIIQGTEITGTTLENIDLKVELDTQTIPAETVSKLAGNAATMQLSLVHEGEFGFKANLKVSVGVEHAGKNGKLYYYNANNELEPAGGNVVGADGTIVLEFSHASDYVIVIEEMEEDNSGAIWWILLAVAAVGAAAAAAVVITRKKRSK